MNAQRPPSSRKKRPERAAAAPTNTQPEGVPFLDWLQETETDRLISQKIGSESRYRLVNRFLTVIMVLFGLIVVLFLLLTLRTPGMPFGKLYTFDVTVVVPLISIAIAVIALFLYIYELRGEVKFIRQYSGQWPGLKRITYRQLAFGLAVIFPALFAFCTLLAYLSLITQLAAMDWMLLSFAGFCAPLGIYRIYRDRTLQHLDRRLPDLLHDLAESARAGMPLHRAVIKAARGNYGELNRDIEIMSAQLQWEIPFTDVLEMFGRRVNTPLLNRALVLIDEASKAGGDIADVLTIAADDTRAIQQIEYERTNTLNSYITIIYVAFFVFLAVITIVFNMLTPMVEDLHEVPTPEDADVEGSPSLSILTGRPGTTMLPRLRFYCYLAVIIQGVSAGLIAGTMLEGEMRAGLLHVFVFLAATLVVFNFVVVHP